MTLAIGHCESSGVAVLDCVREIRPPFSPDQVVEEFAALLKSYGISRVTGDAYAGEWPRERFASHGITYDVSSRNKSQIYTEFLPALNGQRVRLLDLPRLMASFARSSAARLAADATASIMRPARTTTLPTQCVAFW